MFPNIRLFLVIIHLWIITSSEQILPRWLPTIPKQNVDISLLTNHEINQAISSADQKISKRRETEKNLAIQGRSMKFQIDASNQHFSMNSPKVVSLERCGERFEEITKNLARRFNLSSEKIIFGFPQTDLSGTSARPLLEECKNEFQTRCKNEKYRTFDGSCNNIRHPGWGKSFICFRRILAPSYVDGISKPRLAKDGQALPNPRDLSLTIHRHRDRPATRYTMMAMSWGQFTDHDITLTPVTRTADDKMIQCCESDQSNHSQCLPISVKSDDPFYSQFKQECINYVRSAMCPSCTFGPRQQMNELNSFVDVSHVYGLTLNISRSLRTNAGDGKLLTRKFGKEEVLPQSINPNNDRCSIPQQNLFCFRAGDKRLNQQPGLTSLHTILARRHNRLAEKLKLLNPNWSEEKIYQEARRIVGAQMQMITWNEYLPVVLGPVYATFYKIQIPRLGFTQYNPSINPSLLIEFSAAAYRFGHSLIDTHFQIKSSSWPSSITLENYFSPFELYNGLAGPVLNGIASQPAQSFDTAMAPSVTNFLHRRKGKDTGLDLASLNIQRGRDNGLPGYTAYIKHIFRVSVKSFRDLHRFMSREMIQEFQKAYRSVEDIDLFSGGLAERPVYRGIVGPTFATIIGIQFHRLKFGDRFFFTHKDQIGSFTAAQLKELKKTKLANLICGNTAITEIQRNVFLIASRWNPTVLCRNLSDFDLSPWKE